MLATAVGAVLGRPLMSYTFSWSSGASMMYALVSSGEIEMPWDGSLVGHEHEPLNGSV